MQFNRIKNYEARVRKKQQKNPFPVTFITSFATFYLLRKHTSNTCVIKRETFCLVSLFHHQGNARVHFCASLLRISVVTKLLSFVNHENA